MLRDYLQRFMVLRALPKDIPLWIEKELFPWMPGEIERLFLKGRRYIVDFDDAIHAWYKPYPVFRNKFATLVRGASEVHAGNAFLAEESSSFQSNVRMFPTVLDPDEYLKRRERSDRSKLIVGWIGGPLSQRYLQEIIPTLESFDAVPVELRCMGVDPILRTSLPLTRYPWSAAAEKEFCALFDVGIMPLSREPFSQGKCGFKLLQYMSAGVATIASRSRANSDILESGRCGILVSTDQEWKAALKNLHEKPGLLRTLGSAGLKRVQEAYSQRTWAPVWVEAIQRLVSGTSASDVHVPSDGASGQVS